MMTYRRVLVLYSAIPHENSDTYNEMESASEIARVSNNIVKFTSLVIMLYRELLVLHWQECLEL